MICARCDKPIRRDEKYQPVDNHAASGPGSTLYIHVRRCPRAPQQTFPARRFGA
jgi:hypothetical protein